MNLNAILSIKPKYVEEIIEGRKIYEYRKCIFKKNVQRVYIYSTYPDKKIVGYFNFSGYIKDTPQNIWEKTKKYSGIDKKSYDEYFDNRSIGYALNIKKFYKFKEPLDPKLIFEQFVAPQSYKYIDQNINVE